MRLRVEHVAVAALLTVPVARSVAQGTDSLLIAGLKWRAIGPAHSGGRLSDVVGIPGPSKTLYIATAAGGIWKTMNNGVTWRPLFDDKAIASGGVVAIAPSDTQQVWFGTGEPNARYPTEAGGGVFKSADGGATWQSMGLEKTQRIGRIVVHPTNPNIVYVAALGALYGPNPERGLYKTTDGGKTWTLSKFISDKAGFVDVAMDPKDPEVLYAASWQMRRTPYSIESGGIGSGLWKTTNGGSTWTEITGNGFPTGIKGRVGLAIAPSNSSVVYAMVEAARPTTNGTYVTEYHPINIGLYRSTDAGKTWEKRNDYNDRPFYYSQVRVDPKNPDRVYFSSSPVQLSDDGGKTSRAAANGPHIDTHGIWIDPNDPERWAIANDGGFSITFDKGGTFFSPMNLPLTQFYHIGLDNSVPYNVCGGSQDNGAFCGPSRRKSGPLSNAYWSQITGGDAVYATPDPSDPNTVYAEVVTGALSRLDLRGNGRATVKKPNWEARYQIWEDSIAVIRGDPLRPATREQTAAITALRTKQRQDSVDWDVRYGWETALLVSPHNSSTIYWGGSRVQRSTDRGDHMVVISPDLTKKQYAKIDTSMHLTGGVSLETTMTELYGYTTALAESFVKPGLIYAGTDDGNVWLSPNDGIEWQNVTSRMPGIPQFGYVSSIEASHFDSLAFYVTVDNHRVNDNKPYVYATTDGGKTFKSIAGNLPMTGVVDYLHVIREDPHNRNLLFVGSSSGVYVSTDRGTTWTRFMTGLPTVPVFDLQIHERDREIVAGTHGRSFWIADIAPLEQWSAQVASSKSFLFTPKTGWQWSEGSTRGNDEGQATFAVQSPPYGAAITYRLTAAAPDARIVISDALGDTLATLRGPTTPGVHTVYWNYQTPAPPRARAALTVSERRDSILKANRAPAVLDSLRKAGYDTIAIARASALLGMGPGQTTGARGGRGGGGGGGGGGRGGRGGGGAADGGVATACYRPLTQWDPFCARPGEGAITGPRPDQGPFTSPLVVNAADPKKVLRVFDIIGVSYFNTPGRTFLGSGNAAVAGPRTAGPGDYVVTLTAGTDVMRRKLHIERSGSGTEGGETGGGDIREY